MGLEGVPSGHKRLVRISSLAYARIRAKRIVHGANRKAYWNSVSQRGDKVRVGTLE